MMPPTVIEIDRRDAGHTVAAVLKANLGLSWSQAKRLVEGHHVRYAGQVIGDPAHRVKFGKRITIAAGAFEKKASGGRKPPVDTPPPRPGPGSKRGPAKTTRSLPAKTTGGLRP